MTALKLRPQPATRPPYQPDPRNGEVYVTSGTDIIYEPDGQEFYGPLEFMWIHMSAGGGGASCKSGFATLRAAERSAFKEAKRSNAVFVPISSGERR